MTWQTDLDIFSEDISLDKFVKNLGDGNRGNKFLVDFSPLIAKFPDIITAGDLDKIKFMVTAAPIPGTTTDTITANWQGMPTAYAGNHAAQTWTTTFLSDTKFVAEKFIDAWRSKIHDLVTNKKGTVDQYKMGCEIRVHQLNESGKIIEQTKLVNIFPTVKGERSGDTASAEFQSFSVTWAYDYPVKNYSTVIESASRQ